MSIYNPINNEKDINEKDINEKSIYDQIKAEYEAKLITRVNICDHLVNLVKDFRDEITKTLEIGNESISSLDQDYDGLPYLFIDLSNDRIQKRPNEINLEDVSVDRQDEFNVLYYIDYLIIIYLGLDPFHQRDKFIYIPYRTSLLNGESITIQVKTHNHDIGSTKEDVLRCESEYEYNREKYKAVTDFINRVKEKIKNS